MMDVFISWSGQRSRLAAEALADWIPLIFQSVSPWVSSRDITAGSRWASELSRKLENTKLGVLCVTRQNQISPWLVYEAGALSKSLDDAMVVPYLLDCDASSLVGPIAHFQAVKADRVGTRSLVEGIARSHSLNRRSVVALDEVFQALWPKLESKLLEIAEHDNSSGFSLHPVKMVVKGSERPNEITELIEDAEASESIGDAWSARDAYAKAVKRSRELGLTDIAKEMERRMNINISITAALMRGD